MSEKRENIVAAALKLFCEQGFHHTSTTSISKEAGVGTGTLFLYFSSKDVLINSLYREAKGQLSAHLQQDYPEDAGVKERIKHIWFTACWWALSNPEAFRFIHMFKSSPYISNITREEAASAANFAEQLVQEGIISGLLIPMETNLLFTLFDGLLASTVNYFMQTNVEAERQGIIGQVFEVLWKGIASNAE